jgi:DNA-binding MarR family transcriptional regulator
VSDTSSRLQRELRQTRPFSSTAEEAVLGVIRTTDLFRRLAAAVLDEHGITQQQYNVLRILRGAGADGLPTLEVADRMLEQTPGVTRLLDRLESKGLIRRQRCPKDRRRHLCWLTAEGERLLDDLEEPIREQLERCVRGLPARDRKTLIELLDRIRDAHG